MLRIPACLMLGLVLVATAASAGIPDPDFSTVELGPDAVLATCPAGDGPTFEYVTVIAKRADGTPIQGIQAEDIFFTTSGGDVSIYAYDAETDVNGEIRYLAVGNERIYWEPPDGVSIECQIYTIVLNDIDYMPANSFDINGDGCVGLTDFAYFASDYLTGAFRSDYDGNGIVGLTDFAYFASHYLHGCP